MPGRAAATLHGQDACFRYWRRDRCESPPGPFSRRWNEPAAVGRAELPAVALGRASTGRRTWSRGSNVLGVTMPDLTAAFTTAFSQCGRFDDERIGAARPELRHRAHTAREELRADSHKGLWVASSSRHSGSRRSRRSRSDDVPDSRVRQLLAVYSLTSARRDAVNANLTGMAYRLDEFFHIEQSQGWRRAVPWLRFGDSWSTASPINGRMPSMMFAANHYRPQPVPSPSPPTKADLGARGPSHEKPMATSGAKRSTLKAPSRKSREQRRRPPPCAGTRAWPWTGPGTSCRPS